MVNAPIFVKIENYKEVVSIIEHLKKNISDARATIDRFKEIKKQEDTELEEWELSLSDIEKRIENIDNQFVKTEL